MRKPGFFRSSVVSIVTFVFTLSHFCPYAVCGEQKLLGCGGCTYEEARENMAIFFRQLKKLRAALDETDFNPAAKAKVIGPEIGDIYRFVRDEIAYQPYHGALRLAQGTLMSRAGNSYDQSLLLGAMLRAHGYNVRYARKQLTESRAKQLIAVTGQPRPFNISLQPEQSSDALSAEMMADEDIKEMQTLNEAFMDLFMGELLLEFDVDYNLLTDKLASAGIDLKQPTENLLPQAKDHCWVQVQSKGRWRDLDPSLPSLKAGQRLTKPGSVSESISADDVAHKLKFAIFIEQTEGEKKQAKMVLEHTANLTQTINDISVMIVPEIAGGSASKAFSDPNFIRTFNVIYPVVHVNGNSFTGQPFDLEGDIVSTDPRIRQAEKIKKPVKKGFETTTNILGGIFGDKQAAEEKAPKTPKLTKVWLTVSLIRPDGKTKTLERGLAKRLEGNGITDESADFDLRRQFLSSFDMLASGSGMTERYLQSYYLDHYLANRRAFFMLLNHSYGKRVPNQNEIMDNRLKPYPFEILKFLEIRRSIMDSNAAGIFPGLSAFTAEPQVVSFRRSIATSQNGEPVLQQRFDIMFNSVEAFELSQGNAQTDRSAEFRLQQGVLDTLIEYLMLGGGDTISAHSILAKAIETGVTLEVVRSGDKAALTKLDIDEEIRTALTRDLDQGFAVLIPVEPVMVDTNPVFAWWRIHPATGETLGIVGLGEGAAAKEYSILTDLAWSLGTSLALCGLFAYFGQVEDGWDFAKCVAIGTVLGVGGGAAGHFGGTGGLLIFNILTCQLLLGLRQLDAPPLGPGTRTAGAAGNSAASAVADVAMCVAIGMAIPFAIRGGGKWKPMPSGTSGPRVRPPGPRAPGGRPTAQPPGRIPPPPGPPRPLPTSPGGRPTAQPPGSIPPPPGAPRPLPTSPGGRPTAQPPGSISPPPGAPRPLPTSPGGRPTAQPPGSIPPPPGAPRPLPTSPGGRPTAQPPGSIPPPPGPPRPLPASPGSRPTAPPRTQNLRQAVENGRQAAENLNRVTQEALRKTNQLTEQAARRNLANRGRQALEDVKKAAEEVRRLTQQAERGAAEARRRAQTATGQQGAQPPR